MDQLRPPQAGAQMDQRGLPLTALDELSEGALGSLLGPTQPSTCLFNLFQCFIIKETLTEPCLCWIGNGRQFGSALNAVDLAVERKAGAERGEPEVDSNPAEFNDRELGQTLQTCAHVLGPCPWEA